MFFKSQISPTYNSEAAKLDFKRAAIAPSWSGHRHLIIDRGETDPKNSPESVSMPPLSQMDEMGRNFVGLNIYQGSLDSQDGDCLGPSRPLDQKSGSETFVQDWVRERE